MCLSCFLPRFLELATELCEIDAVLRGFVSSDENNGNIPAIFLGQFGIQIDIHLAQSRPEFAEQGEDDGLCFLAKVAVGPGVESDFQRVAGTEAFVFR